ncbi:MAG: thermonuclease family protein [Planctomycetota bacterium]|jgi:endonuclease YncB( thermonuclease family)
MTRLFPYLMILCLGSGCLWSYGGSPTESLLTEEDQPQDIDWTLVTRKFPVLRVLSGDTLEVDYPIRGSWERVKVKLLGVDAPDRLPRIMTEYQGLAAFAMVLIALDRRESNPELLSLTDRDMLQERVNLILDQKRLPSLRGVRLTDDGWETRTQMWPYIPLRASVEYDRKTRKRKLKHLYAYVYAGKLLLNQFLIEEGFARVHPTHLFERREMFEAAEDRARRRGIGIWGVK